MEEDDDDDNDYDYIEDKLLSANGSQALQPAGAGQAPAQEGSTGANGGGGGK
jgi:hypothetical protein